ncbi:hypothetical protein [Sulfuricurvum sp.]|uniref:hypothetical protein n=1 Tax=Sulfuricurvum sp. TaxID=2025608 RepID=UPI003BB7DAEE
MISLSIQEPKIEHFFKHSQEEVIKALRFIVEHEIDYGEHLDELSTEQKKELSESCHIADLAVFNDTQSLHISHRIDIASLADDINL